MSPRDRLALQRVIDDVANALQRAIGLAIAMRRETQSTADDAVALEAAIGRALSGLQRVQPRRGGDR